MQKSECKKSANIIFSFVNPNLLTKELNFEFIPPVKNSNSNVTSDSSVLLIFLINSSISSFLSLKESAFSSIVLSTSGKIFCNCCDNCRCPIGGRTSFFGVIEIVLFFSSVISVIGLEKLSTLGLDGRGTIVGSMFLSGGTLLSGDKKLVSLDGVIGVKFFHKTSLDKIGKSRSYSKREGCFFGGPLIVEAGVLN